MLGIGDVSVHLSVTCWYCVKTNSRKIIRFSPADSTETVVFSTNFHILCFRRSPLPATVSNETGVGVNGEKCRCLKPIIRCMSKTIDDAYMCSVRFIGSCIIGLRLVPISVTLNDLSDCNVLLYSIHVSLVFSGARCVKVNEDRHILSAAMRYLIAADSVCVCPCSSSMLLGM